MLVKVLGAAAGGAFPQWNCACDQCRRVRLGTFAGHPRSQAQIAVSEDSVAWTLLNASPDLRTQIESTPQLWPAGSSLHSPVQSVIVTSAEADAVAGLLSLREFQPLDIWASPSVLRIIREDNSLFGLLNRLPQQAVWKQIHPGVAFCTSDGVRVHPISMPGGFPSFVNPSRRAELDTCDAVLGLIIESRNGGRIAYLPGVANIEDSWRPLLDDCDVLLFDGTFWTDDELCRVRGDGKPASAMGHLPISGPHGSLAALRDLKCTRKIFFHINNTNPILDESSKAHAEVLSAGWEIARDGMEIYI